MDAQQQQQQQRIACDEELDIYLGFIEQDYYNGHENFDFFETLPANPIVSSPKVLDALPTEANPQLPLTQDANRQVSEEGADISLTPSEFFAALPTDVLQQQPSIQVSHQQLQVMQPAPQLPGPAFSQPHSNKVLVRQPPRIQLALQISGQAYPQLPATQVSNQEHVMLPASKSVENIAPRPPPILESFPQHAEASHQFKPAHTCSRYVTPQQLHQDPYVDRNTIQTKHPINPHEMFQKQYQGPDGYNNSAPPNNRLNVYVAPQHQDGVPNGYTNPAQPNHTIDPHMLSSQHHRVPIKCKSTVQPIITVSPQVLQSKKHGFPDGYRNPVLANDVSLHGPGSHAERINDLDQKNRPVHPPTTVSDVGYFNQSAGQPVYSPRPGVKAEVVSNNSQPKNAGISYAQANHPPPQHLVHKSSAGSNAGFADAQAHQPSTSHAKRSDIKPMPSIYVNKPAVFANPGDQGSKTPENLMKRGQINRIARVSRRDKMPDTSQWYDGTQAPPESWGRYVKAGNDKLPQFRYTEHGELEPNIVFDSTTDLRRYLDGKPGGNPDQPKGYSWEPRKPRPGEWIVEGKKRESLTIWIALAPAMNNHRYPGKSLHCRLRNCMLSDDSKRTIKTPQPIVIFDERMNVDGHRFDPHHNAGYMHLACFESCLDIAAVVERYDVRLDTRAFVKEEMNACALNRDEKKYQKKDFVSKVEHYLKWQWQKYQEHLERLKRNHEERGSGRKIYRDRTDEDKLHIRIENYLKDTQKPSVKKQTTRRKLQQETDGFLREQLEEINQRQREAWLAEAPGRPLPLEFASDRITQKEQRDLGKVLWSYKIQVNPGETSQPYVDDNISPTSPFPPIPPRRLPAILPVGQQQHSHHLPIEPGPSTYSASVIQQQYMGVKRSRPADDDEAYDGASSSKILRVTPQSAHSAPNGEQTRAAHFTQVSQHAHPGQAPQTSQQNIGINLGQPEDGSDAPYEVAINKRQHVEPYATCPVPANQISGSLSPDFPTFQAQELQAAPASTRKRPRGEATEEVFGNADLVSNKARMPPEKKLRPSRPSAHTMRNSSLRGVPSKKYEYSDTVETRPIGDHDAPEIGGWDIKPEDGSLLAFTSPRNINVSALDFNPDQDLPSEDFFNFDGL